jgi:hypothetical protein
MSKNKNAPTLIAVILSGIALVVLLTLALGDNSVTVQPTKVPQDAGSQIADAVIMGAAEQTIAEGAAIGLLLVTLLFWLPALLVSLFSIKHLHLQTRTWKSLSMLSLTFEATYLAIICLELLKAN